MNRDTHRSAVYAAEEQVAAALARGGSVDFFGSRLTLPVERRFADQESVQRYVDAVLQLASVRLAWPDAAPVLVRERRGVRRATYADAVISLPLAGLADQRWAAREMVVLHELTHHLVPDDPPHGSNFCAGLLGLLGLVIGPEVELLLRASLDSAGVPVAARRWARVAP